MIVIDVDVLIWRFLPFQCNIHSDLYDIKREDIVTDRVK